MSSDLYLQTKNAFEFVQKLYFEVSYLIKEVEGLLQQDDEKFIILRPSGYGVTAKSSTGLEPANVEQWLTKEFTVFFCPEVMVKTKGGQTITAFHGKLKILFINIKVLDKEHEEPSIFLGCIREISSKKTGYTKLEHLLWEFAYNGNKIIKALENTKSYEDSYCSFKGEIKRQNLFSITNSEEVLKKIVTPLIELFKAVT